MLNPLDALGQIPQIERAALIALYNSTTGDAWTENSGWKDGQLDPADGFTLPGTECGWFGVACDDKGNYVEGLFFYENNLTNTIPSEIGNFSNLSNLGLEKNQLTGSIPPEIGNLTNLTHIYLYDNQLSGTIPSELGNLTDLVILHLANNQLSGTIPSELGNLINLTGLLLRNNQLTGSIPPEIGNLINLQHLNLEVNQLTGSIPPELGNLNNLTYIYLYDNQLGGSIPSEFGNLVNLEILQLGWNQLSDKIPSTMGNLNNLEELWLSDNHLWGCIPESVGSLSSLKFLRMGHNWLSGEIPKELMNLNSMVDGASDFRNNHLYTTNTDLRDFLNQKQEGSDWESSQNFDTTIPMIEPLAVCGVFIGDNCFPTFEEAFTFETSPTVIFVGEGEYQENVIVENGFTLELTWAHDFSCNPPTGPVIISGPVPAD